VNVTRAPHKVFLGSAIIETNPHVVSVVLSHNVIDRLLLVRVLNMNEVSAPGGAVTLRSRPRGPSVHELVTRAVDGKQIAVERGRVLIVGVATSVHTCNK